jgi:hypothetical protein
MDVAIASPALAALNDAVARAVRPVSNENSRQFCIALETLLGEDLLKAGPSD